MQRMRCLLFLLLAFATGRIGPSLFVALLFAVHPINVESVAWVAERKNVLSTFFFLAATRRLRMVRRKTALAAISGGGRLVCFGLDVQADGDYVALHACSAGLLAPGQDPKAVRHMLRLRFQSSLPGCWRRSCHCSLLSAASAVITMQAQQAGGAMRSTAQFSFGVRLENAVVAYAMYLWKMIWPSHLAPIYPHPGDSLAAWQVGVSLLVLLAVTAFVLAYRSKRYLLTGWLWFLGTLVPVIGLVQVGDQAMADRYAYIPFIGIFVMIAWGVADFANWRQIGIAAPMVSAACILLALSVATHRQLGYWSSNYDLWTHALAVTNKNFIAQDNLGGALLLLGKPDEAYSHFQAAAEINPSDPMSRSNLGAYLQEHGHLEQAIEQYKASSAYF